MNTVILRDFETYGQDVPGLCERNGQITTIDTATRDTGYELSLPEPKPRTSIEEFLAEYIKVQQFHPNEIVQND